MEKTKKETVFPRVQHIPDRISLTKQVILGYPVIKPGVGAQSFWFFSFVPPEDLEQRKINVVHVTYPSVLLHVI